jgi:hypothetical protein
MSTPTAAQGSTPPMLELLERAGFRVRGRNRADCIHCSGHSIATVSFTDEVAHCFRCEWKANTITLKKELGLFGDNPAAKRGWRQERRERERHRLIIRRFEAWRGGHINRLSAELRQLGRNAVLAADVLKHYPNCGPAWDAFARYCHSEGELNWILDWLTCTKASPWLEKDSTIIDVFELWKDNFDAKC